MLILVRKLESHVDDEHLTIVLKSSTVETDLFNPSKRNDTKGVFGGGGRMKLLIAEVFSERFLRSNEWKCPLVAEFRDGDKARSSTKSINDGGLGTVVLAGKISGFPFRSSNLLRTSV